MAHETESKRVDAASRTMSASPSAIYAALTQADAVASWLPPDGMKGVVEAFEPRVGGRFRMTLTYEDSAHAAAGKTSKDSDTVEGRFVELVPQRRVVQAFEFESDDPAFAGTMTMTWDIESVAEGTQVSIRCEDVPAGIGQDDHLDGLRSSLANLAEFTERGS